MAQADCKAIHLKQQGHEFNFNKKYAPVANPPRLDLNLGDAKDQLVYYELAEDEEEEEEEEEVQLGKRQREDDGNGDDDEDGHVDKERRLSLTPPPGNQLQGQI